MTQEKKEGVWRLVIILAAAFATASAGITTYTIEEVDRCRNSIQSMAIDLAVIKSNRFTHVDAERLTHRVASLEYWRKTINGRHAREDN